MNIQYTITLAEWLLLQIAPILVMVVYGIVGNHLFSALLPDGLTDQQVDWKLIRRRLIRFGLLYAVFMGLGLTVMGYEEYDWVIMLASIGGFVLGALSPTPAWASKKRIET